MKASRDRDGKLIVAAETGVEAYAPRKWNEEQGVLQIVTSQYQPATEQPEEEF